jgi:hypothetical protein
LTNVNLIFAILTIALYSQQHCAETKVFLSHSDIGLPYPILVILFMPFGFYAPEYCKFGFPFFLALSVPDEGYSKNTSCALNLKLIYMFYHVCMT